MHSLAQLCGQIDRQTRHPQNRRLKRGRRQEMNAYRACLFSRRDTPGASSLSSHSFGLEQPQEVLDEMVKEERRERSWLKQQGNRSRGKGFDRGEKAGGKMERYASVLFVWDGGCQTARLHFASSFTVRPHISPRRV